MTAKAIPREVWTQPGYKHEEDEAGTIYLLPMGTSSNYSPRRPPGCPIEEQCRIVDLGRYSPVTRVKRTLAALSMTSRATLQTSVCLVPLAAVQPAYVWITMCSTSRQIGRKEHEEMYRAAGLLP